MGSHYKKAIFGDPVSNAVTDWSNKARANIRQLRHHGQKNFKGCERESSSEGTSRSNSHSQECNRPHRLHVHSHHCGRSSNLDPSRDILSPAHEFITHPEITRSPGQAPSPGPPKDDRDRDLASNPARHELKTYNEREMIAQHSRMMSCCTSDHGGLGVDSRSCCGECGRLGFAFLPDHNVFEHDTLLQGNLGKEVPCGNTSPSCQSHESSSAFPSNYSRPPTPAPAPAKSSTTTATIYHRITSEETSDGSPRWSLECGECKSLRVFPVTQNEGKHRIMEIVSDSSDHDIEHAAPTTQDQIRKFGLRKRAVFLKLPSVAGTVGDLHGGLPETSRRPYLDRMRRLPSRELREIRMAETDAPTLLETFRTGDLEIPELMRCTSVVNDPMEVLEFTKSALFSRTGLTSANQSTTSCHPDFCCSSESKGEFVESASFTTALLAAAATESRDSVELVENRKSLDFTAAPLPPLHPESPHQAGN